MMNIVIYKLYLSTHSTLEEAGVKSDLERIWLKLLENDYIALYLILCKVSCNNYEYTFFPKIFWARPL